MRRGFLPTLALAMIATGVAAQAKPGDEASADMKDRNGKSVGAIRAIEAPHGILLRGELVDVPPGPHGFHIHAVGKCEAPFTSAGGHFNPTGKKHGFEAVDGAHAGDLPNLHVGADGKVVVDTLVAGVTFASDSNGLFDADGSSIVIHAKADDYKTDPAGDSGDRIACGVVQKRG